MIRSISNDARELQRIWRALIAYFDFEEPTEFSVFEQEGFPPTWATQEFRRASQQLDPRCSLAAGIQLWQVGHDGAREAVAAALAAQPRGVIGYCYSWASKEELEAAGATLMPLLSQAPFSSW